MNKLIDNNRQGSEPQALDFFATTAAIREAGYAVKGWCRIRGIDYSSMYRALHGQRGQRGTRGREPQVTREILSRLEQEGFLRFKDVSNG